MLIIISVYPGPIYAIALPPGTVAASPSKASVSSPGMRESESSLRIAVGSYVEAKDNHITVVGLDPLADHNNLELDMADPWDPTPEPQHSPSSALVPLARTQHTYPCTAMEFSPAGSMSSTYQGNTRTSYELIATTSDCLRLWNLINDSHSMGSGSFRLESRAVLANVRRFPFCVIRRIFSIIFYSFFAFLLVQSPAKCSLDFFFMVKCRS